VGGEAIENLAAMRCPADRGAIRGAATVEARHAMSPRKDPSKPPAPDNALAYFTDREELIDAFHRHLDAPEGEPLRVLVFYGVGGIGKTTLVKKLCADLRGAAPPVPHASA
jgi:hypothetical protein